LFSATYRAVGGARIRGLRTSLRSWFDKRRLLLGLRAANARARGRLAKYPGRRERPDDHSGDQRDQPERACNAPEHLWIYLPEKTPEPACASPLS
jgi:hypothetical protein